MLNKHIMGLNSARKYRPTTFDKILGQDNIINVLRNQVLKGEISNAYLFYGQRGTGKTTTARVFAKAINCENAINNNANPCNTCQYCTKSNISIFELDAASNNSVEDIRDIIEKAKFVPIFSKWNIFIIDEVHMLSQSAFNSFLKTLEEPPKNTLFILITTEFNKIPATILSRCQLFNFRLIDSNVIANELKEILKDKNIQYGDEALYIIAEKAEGGMRNALSILDSITCYSDNINSQIVKKILNILDDDIYFNLLDTILHSNKDTLLVEYDNILQSGFSKYSFFEGLLTFFLNLYLAKNENSSKLICKTQNSITKFKTIAENIDYTKIEKVIKLINEKSITYKNTINKRLFTNITLIEIYECLK